MHIEFRNVVKSFGHGRHRRPAVNGVSWEASGGEVFGILGPNGAGKTTMIRLMLDILRPDGGDILVDGCTRSIRERAYKRRVGYLPEERSLYKKRKILDTLVYLAVLKGLSRAQARRRALTWLERFGLEDCAGKAIGQLSKGMGQKVQIISCLLHDPDLLVLDEPFSGLDPVNALFVRELLSELKSAGKLIFLSTHAMAQVEALCDRIFMIHQGEQVLYGNLRDTKRSFVDHEVVLDVEAHPEGLSSVLHVDCTPEGKQVRLQAGRTIHDLMAEMSTEHRAVRRIEEASRPLEDIFVSLIRGNEYDG